MRILIGFEKSGILRDRLVRAGHDVLSLDLAEGEGEFVSHHLVEDFNVFARSKTAELFDSAILHPPCTRLTAAGRRWLDEPPRGKTFGAIWRELDEAAAMFAFCLSFLQKMSSGAIENPPMHHIAKQKIKNYRSYDQVVRPCLFGQKSMKPLCMWLHNLPFLKATDHIKPRYVNDPEWMHTSSVGDSINRSDERSESFSSVADQMVEQWYK